VIDIKINAAIGKVNTQTAAVQIKISQTNADLQGILQNGWGPISF